MIKQGNKWQSAANRDKVRALAEMAVREEQKENLLEEARRQNVVLSADELSELLEEQMQDPSIQKVIEYMMARYLQTKSSFHQSEPVSRSIAGPDHDGDSDVLRP